MNPEEPFNAPFLGGNLSTFDFDLPGIGETDALAEGNEMFGMYNPEGGDISQYVDIGSDMQHAPQDAGNAFPDLSATASLDNNERVEVLDQQQEEGTNLLSMDEDMPQALDDMDASENFSVSETPPELLMPGAVDIADNNTFPEGNLTINNAVPMNIDTPVSMQESVVGTPAGTVPSTVGAATGGDKTDCGNDTDEDTYEENGTEEEEEEEDYGFPTNVTGRSESAVRILEVHQIEKKIVELLETASKAIRVLAGGNDDSDPKANADASGEFERLSTNYFDLLNEIHVGIRKQAQYLSKTDISGTCLPFRASSHGETKELEAWTRAAGIFRLGLKNATAFASESPRD